MARPTANAFAPRLLNHFQQITGNELGAATILDFSASTPTSKYKPVRLRGLAFTGLTRVSEKRYLAFRNLPDFQEFQMLMSSASFQERIRHDRAMRAKHVETLRKLFGISPEEEEDMHRE